MTYQSSRLGPFDLKENEIIRFPEGLYGFEHETRFALLPFDPNIDCPLKWLQSLGNPDLAFVVTDPFLFRPDYRATLSSEERMLIGAGPQDQLCILVIVKVPDDYTKMTGNLVAPVVINPRTLNARQFVLSSPEYDTAHYLLPEEIRAGQAAQPA